MLEYTSNNQDPLYYRRKPTITNRAECLRRMPNRRNILQRSANTYGFISRSISSECSIAEKVSHDAAYIN